MSDHVNYKDLNKNSQSLLGQLGKKQGKVMQAFQGLHQSALQAGELDSKTKELISLAIGIHSQCNRCIGLHTAAALKAGATSGEIEETIGVATLMGGGPALMYGLEALQALEDLQE